MSTIKDLLYKNRLIVLKDQSVSDQGYCDFANLRFGFPVPYLQGNYHHPEHPLIFVSSNVKQDGKQIGVPRTGGYWHSDTAFEREPKVITMLLPKVLPPTSPRSTRFIDMARSMRLPGPRGPSSTAPSLLTAAAGATRCAPEDAGYDITEILKAHRHHAPPVRHPAVIDHPYTRRGSSTQRAASRSGSPIGRWTNRPRS